MLFEPSVVKGVFEKYKINIKGILHVGSHLCEEKDIYNNIFNVTDDNIIWVDANKSIVDKNIQRGIPNCYVAALDDCEKFVSFNITNNGQSSSLLELGTHKHTYPDIYVSEKKTVRTQTLEQFLQRNVINIMNYNVWNFDIQGSEYAVFKGSEYLLEYADVIYTEVNTADVYMGCGKLPELDSLLAKHGLHRVASHILDELYWGDAIYIRTNNPI
jgi:FkbM family methyltransferase